MKKIFAITLFAVATAAHAAPAPTAGDDAWIGARPSIRIQVSPAVNGTFRVKATVTDLRNGNVLSEPLLLVKGGVPAKAKIGATGAPDATTVAFTVTVAPDGKSAIYNSEVRSNGEVIAAEEANLVIGG